MLVTPAATAQLLAVRFTRLMAVAALVGIASAVLGLYLSYWLDVASGATIVLVQTGLFLLALVLGPRGMLARRRAVRGRRCGGRGVTGAPRPLVAGARRRGLPADRAAPRRSPSLVAGAGRPLHGRRPRRRRAQPAPADRAGDDLPGARRVRRPRPRRAGRPARRRPRLRRLRPGPPPPRDLHPLRPLAGHRRPRPRATCWRRSATGSGSASRPTGWSCSACAPRAERPAHPRPSREGRLASSPASSRARGRGRSSRSSWPAAAIGPRRVRRVRHRTPTRSRSSPRRRCSRTSSPRSAATRVDVHSLVPKGGEVHTFDPTPADVRADRRTPT